jgi:hypothetical protein
VAAGLRVKKQVTALVAGACTLGWPTVKRVALLCRWQEGSRSSVINICKRLLIVDDGVPLLLLTVSRVSAACLLLIRGDL